jgi:glycosyltransferase involved in cell wall biosynthesis
VATSKYTKKDLVKFYKVDPKKIEVVYQDCHPQFYEFDETLDVREKYGLYKDYILCVGTIEKRKQQLELVEAFSKINFDGELILIGKKTKSFRAIQILLDQNEELNSKVRVLENVSFEDFPHIYNKAMLFAYPSVCEGFGIPIVEAMNTGVPVLTTSRTVMEEVGGDAVAYYEKYSQESLASTLQNLVNDKAYRNELVVKGKERAKLFRKEINLPMLVDLYKKL